MRCDRRPTWLVLSVAGCMTSVDFTAVAAAQGPPARCVVLCAPVISLMPGALRSHLFGGPRVETLATGEVRRLPSVWNAELILVAASKSAIPHLSLFGSVQWFPNATEPRNPFTQYTASELGGAIRANAPTVTLGASGSVLTAAQVAGIADLDVNVADLYSQAARPGDRSAYTHKLDLDLVTHWHVFGWTAPASYIHRVTLFAILDYVATGLPRAGDEVPPGRRFIDHARPTSFIVGVSAPLTPEG